MVRAREQRFAIGLLMPLMAAHAVSGCGTLSPVPPAEVAPAAGMEATVYHHSVHFQPNASDLTDSEAKSLDLFLDALPLDSRIDFHLSWSANEGVGKARIPDLAALRLSSVSKHVLHLLGGRVEFDISVLDQRGAYFAEGRLSSLPDTSSVNISATSYRVRLANCWIWSSDLGYDSSSVVSRNLGCASVINLGLMIANPADLERGSRSGGSDGDREADAVGRYRADKIKELGRDGATKQ